MHGGFLSGKVVDIFFVVVLLCHIMEFVIVFGLALVSRVCYRIFDWMFMGIRIFEKVIISQPSIGWKGGTRPRRKGCGIEYQFNSSLRYSKPCSWRTQT